MNLREYLDVIIMFIELLKLEATAYMLWGLPWYCITPDVCTVNDGPVPAPSVMVLALNEKFCDVDLGEEIDAHLDAYFANKVQEPCVSMHSYVFPAYTILNIGWLLLRTTMLHWTLDWLISLWDKSESTNGMAYLPCTCGFILGRDIAGPPDSPVSKWDATCLCMAASVMEFRCIVAFVTCGWDTVQDIVISVAWLFHTPSQCMPLLCGSTRMLSSDVMPCRKDSIYLC